MNIRSCQVTLRDTDGVRHSVVITASTLYEAVAMGLMAIRQQDWSGRIAEGLNTADVTVNTIPVTHTVRLQDFRRWLDRSGGTPKEISNRNHVRRILGLVENGKP